MWPMDDFTWSNSQVQGGNFALDEGKWHPQYLVCFTWLFYF
jgi:hypothetical protein